MSMVEHQVKELREMSIRQRNNAKVSEKVFFEIENALSQAADTIEALSAKLTAANMENGGGWISCEDRFPKKDGFYLATIDGEIAGEDKPFSGLAEFENGKWVDDEDDYQCILAWQPLPEPYRP